MSKGRRHCLGPVKLDLHSSAWRSRDGSEALFDNPSPVFVPKEMKATICFRCGHVRLINIDEKHKDCGLCGHKIDPESQR